MSRLVLSVTVSAIFIWVTPGLGQSREDAVAQAREGHTREAIAALRKLLTENPGDSLVAFDLAVILTWAKRPREATDVFERAGNTEPPEYALGPMIRAYRDQKQFAKAERWARVAGERFPQDAAWKKLRGLILADQGRTAEALTLLKPMTTENPTDAEIWLALGYAARRAKDRANALRNYRQALLLQSDNREAADAIAALLAEMREASLASRADHAALLIRRGESYSPRDPRRRFEITDAALKALDSLLREARSTNADRGLILRIRRDQVKAIRNRERWAEAVAAAEKLRTDDDELPPYVIEAEADALLALRRPEEARKNYETVLRADPGNRNAHIGRFFCFVEEENFPDAFLEVDAVGDEVLAAQARRFADMQSDAWRRLKPVFDAAPANAELRRLKGDLAAGRGWPRLSDDEIHAAAGLAPENRGVQLSLAETAMRRLRWDEARERIAELIEIYPDDVAVRRAERDLRVHDSFELRAEFRARHEEENGTGTVPGSAPGSGNEERVWLFSRPLEKDWRIVAAWERYEANVTEGRALRYREGAGIELRLPDVTLALMGWQNDGALSKPGADAAVTWQPTDQWSFSLDGSYFTGDTPLRAVLNQITANSVGGAVQYAWHESRSLRFYAHRYDFSDGNERTSGGLSFNQKIVDVPHLDITLRPELYASENSSNLGPYFSPLRDFSGSVTIDAEHLLWRRYERSFGHRLALTGGSYWQKNYGSAWTGNILYEQVWQNNPWCELRWGVQFNRAVYDGDATRSVQTFIRLNWRF